MWGQGFLRTTFFLNSRPGAQLFLSFCIIGQFVGGDTRWQAFHADTCMQANMKRHAYHLTGFAFK